MKCSFGKADQKCNTTYSFIGLLTRLRTAAGGQFGWGGTLLKRYQ